MYGSHHHGRTRHRHSYPHAFRNHLHPASAPIYFRFDRACVVCSGTGISYNVGAGCAGMNSCTTPTTKREGGRRRDAHDLVCTHDRVLLPTNNEDDTKEPRKMASWWSSLAKRKVTDRQPYV